MQRYRGVSIINPFRGRALIAAWILSCTPAQAQEAQPAPVQESLAAACCTIPRGHLVELEIAAPLTSRTSRHGDDFPIRLVAPIVIDGVELVPAGTAGMGEVVHGARSRMGGGAGELTLAVRYLEHAGARIPLHRLRYFQAGRSNEQAATAIAMTPYIGVVALLITGREVRVPAGTIVQAQVAADTALSPPNP